MTSPSQTYKLRPLDLKLYLFFAALFALFVSMTEIDDSFELPFESLATHLFAAGSLISSGFVTSSIATFGYAGVFALMLLESASLPVPSEVILPFAGYLVFTGRMDMATVVMISSAAGVAGALADYYLALKFGRPLIRRLMKLSGAKPGQMDRLERWLDTRGAWSILLARFVPGIRSSISLPAGALRMRLRTFVAMTAVGSFGWSILLVYLGYAAGNLWQGALSQSLPMLGEVALVAVAVASVFYVAYFTSLRLAKGQTGSTKVSP